MAKKDSALLDRYYDAGVNKHILKVIAGDVVVSDEQESIIATVLGSCVAVCLYDLELKLGGMNHFILPENKSDTQIAMRYGAYAIEALINELIKRGSSRGKMRAKLFGGAQVIDHQVEIGRQNAEFALQYLHKEGIKLVCKDILGSLPRRLHFYPTTGKVMVNKIGDEPIVSIVGDIETHLKKNLSKQIAISQKGNVELF